MSEWKRSSSLTMDEWRAIHQSEEIPELRVGAEWQDCPFCVAGVKTNTLAKGLTISGRCLVCIGTGRVLRAEAEEAKVSP